MFKTNGQLSAKESDVCAMKFRQIYLPLAPSASDPRVLANHFVYESRSLQTRHQSNHLTKIVKFMHVVKHLVQGVEEREKDGRKKKWSDEAGRGYAGVGVDFSRK